MPQVSSVGKTGPFPNHVENGRSCVRFTDVGPNSSVFELKTWCFNGVSQGRNGQFIENHLGWVLHRCWCPTWWQMLENVLVASLRCRWPTIYTEASNITEKLPVVVPRRGTRHDYSCSGRCHTRSLPNWYVTVKFVAILLEVSGTISLSNWSS